MVPNNSRDTQAAAPSQQQGRADDEEIECTANGDSPRSIAVGADDDTCRQQLSPLSAPEGLGESGRCERERELCEPGEKNDAEGTTSGDDASPHCPRGSAVAGVEGTGKATPSATAAVRRESLNKPRGRVEDTEGLPPDQASVVAMKGRSGLAEGGVEVKSATEQHQRARDQAKRLALEVARLRSSLRATTSELNAERSVRVRIEVRIDPPIILLPPPPGRASTSRGASRPSPFRHYVE